MAITGAVGAALRQEAPYQAEIQMGAQLIMDFQGSRTGGRAYYWYRGTRYRDPRKIPGWTFARGSAGCAEDSSGRLISFAANEPRITDRGLLGEEERTNKVQIFNANPTALTNVLKLGDAAATLTLVNDASVIAAAGLSGVVTGGQVYKLDNSAGSSNALAAITGQTGNLNTHTLSTYMRGSGQVRIRTGTTSTGFITLNASYARYAQTLTPGVTTDQLEIWASAGAVVYFILPVFEEGALVTSPIVTTGAAATRAADSAYITGLGAILGAPFTLAANADWSVLSDLSAPHLAEANDGTNQNRYALSRDSGANYPARFVAVTAGSAQTASSVPNKSGPRIMRSAGRVRLGGYLLATDGVLGNSAAIVNPSGISRLDLGGRSVNSQQLNGYLQRILICGDLSDAQLQGLTQ